jgi:hypothetical protein
VPVISTMQGAAFHIIEMAGTSPAMTRKVLVSAFLVLQSRSGLCCPG